MTGIYLFWAWVVLSSLGVFGAARFRLGPWPFRLYRPLLLIGFAVTTLAAVSRYVGSASAGNTDSAIGLLYLQGLINPVVRTVVAIEPVATLLYGYIAALPVGGGGNRAHALIILLLWEVMVEDLFLGTLFWLGVGTLWLRLVKRRTRFIEDRERPDEMKESLRRRAKVLIPVLLLAVAAGYFADAHLPGLVAGGERNGLGRLGNLAQRWNWTDGCVAVSNVAMEEIWRAVPNGTPIVIEP